MLLVRWLLFIICRIYATTLDVIPLVSACINTERRVMH